MACTTCSRRPLSTTPSTGLRRLRIIRDGFATADESFIVEVRSDNGVRLHAFVRQDSLVTELVAQPNTEPNPLRVGRAAADRLRSA